MISIEPLGVDKRAGVLIDSNLLVLLVVGSVNPNRIGTFKRTRQYSRSDYTALVRVVGHFARVYTLAQIVAEVSNLTDLTGGERIAARQNLSALLPVLNEPPLPSRRAIEERAYTRLGITDAAIVCAAREHGCCVLTSDLELYLALLQADVPALNFSHLREAEWGMESPV